MCFSLARRGSCLARTGRDGDSDAGVDAGWRQGAHQDHEPGAPHELEFTLGKEFDETRLDGEQCKVRTVNTRKLLE